MPISDRSTSSSLLRDIRDEDRRSPEPLLVAACKGRGGGTLFIVHHLPRTGGSPFALSLHEPHRNDTSNLLLRCSSCFPVGRVFLGNIHDGWVSGQKKKKRTKLRGQRVSPRNVNPMTDGGRLERADKISRSKVGGRIDCSPSVKKSRERILDARIVDRLSNDFPCRSYLALGKLR